MVWVHIYHISLVALITRTPTVDVGSYTYGLGHPMKPHRIRVTHDLVAAYDMLPKMHVLVSSNTFVSALRHYPIVRSTIFRSDPNEPLLK